MSSAKVPPQANKNQIQENPTVLIRYEPETQLVRVGEDALTVLGQLQGAKITSLKSLESSSEILHDGEISLDMIAKTREQFASRVKAAFAPFLKYPVFHGAAINITLTMPLRQQIEQAVQKLRVSRANFLAEEQRKAQQAQLAAEAEQRRINEAAAKKAAEAAKKAGADKETIAEIKQEVLATPAPLVESKAAAVAQSVGASVRYKYYAKVTNLKSLLGACLNNEVLFNTLTAAVPDIQDAFNAMAGAQKEAFNYPGITYEKVAIDVSRGAR